MRVDLYKHGAIGALASVVVLDLHIVAEVYGPKVSAVLGAGILGASYEFLQWYNKSGDPDWKDALATTAGGAAVAACSGTIVALLWALLT